MCLQFIAICVYDIKIPLQIFGAQNAKIYMKLVKKE